MLKYLDIQPSTMKSAFGHCVMILTLLQSLRLYPPLNLRDVPTSLSCPYIMKQNPQPKLYSSQQQPNYAAPENYWHFKRTRKKVHQEESFSVFEGRLSGQ